MNNMHNAGPQYATLTDRQSLRLRCWQAAYGPEYRSLCAIREMLATTSFTTLDEDAEQDFMAEITAAITKLEEMEI